MSGSPDSVVRAFLAAWADPEADELARFFADDAVWVDGTQGVHRGSMAIGDELARQLAISYPTTVEVVTLLADGSTAMAEWRDHWTMRGKSITATVMAVFELDANGRIREWRESYDVKSITDQIESAGFEVT